MDHTGRVAAVVVPEVAQVPGLVVLTAAAVVVPVMVLLGGVVMAAGLWGAGCGSDATPGVPGQDVVGDVEPEVEVAPEILDVVEAKDPMGEEATAVEPAPEGVTEDVGPEADVACRGGEGCDAAEEPADVEEAETLLDLYRRALGM